jgi:surfactin synthase thioesterase subunit
LFCFPYAGGTALIYRKWPDNLPSAIEVCPVQLPGRSNRLREAPFSRMQPLVEALAKALLPRLQKPFAFFGHSMGAAISFELARYLQMEYGLKPVHLFVSGRPAPHVPNKIPDLYNLPDPEFLENLRNLNGTPREVFDNPELIQLMMPLIRADFEINHTYVCLPEPLFDIPITAFGGIQDHDVSREDLESWREYTTASFQLQMMQGDHFFINKSQALLLRLLGRELRQYI